MGTSIPSSRKSQQSLIPTPHLLWVPRPRPVPWPYVTLVQVSSMFQPMCLRIVCMAWTCVYR